MSQMAVDIPDGRHPTYFKAAGDLFLIIGDTRFRIHSSELSDHSGFFRDMLEAGRPIEGEAQADDTPLALPGLTAKQFEMMLDIIYFRYPGPKMNVYEALSLLQLADKFDIPTARRFCLDTLSRRLIPPILRLHYGVKCHVDDWVKMAYGQLMRQSTHRIPSVHIALVDPQLLVDVMRTKELCHEFRKSVFVEPPDVDHDFACKSNAACEAAWKLSFRAGFCLGYLHPDPDVCMSATDATTGFDGVTVPGMPEPCLRRTRDKLLLDRSFAHEIAIVERAIDAALGRGSTEPILTETEAAEMDFYNTRR